MSAIWWNGRYPAVDDLTALGGETMPGHVGIEFVDIGDDWVKARMPVDYRTQQPFRRLHGGASVVLAETVGSVGAMMTIDRERFNVVGLAITANHVRPAHSGWVYGTARPEATGRTTHVWSIRIEDEAGKLVCVSRLTVAVIASEQA